MARKFICALIIITIVFSFTVPVSASTPEIWRAMEAARVEEAAGNIAGAYPHWVRLVDLLRNSTTAGDLENAGIFARRVGDYYAGEMGPFNSSVFDPERATLYYDMAVDFYSRAMAITGTNTLNWAVSEIGVRANLFRATIHIYTERPIGERPPLGRQLAKHEPASGMLFGIFASDPAFIGDDWRKSPDLIRDAVGKDHTALFVYNDWGQPFPAAHAEQMSGRGGALQIALQPMNGLNQVVDGDYIRTWARAARASGVPIFLRFAGEMNGEWTQWGRDALRNPQLYVEKFRLVHGIMAAEAPNVAMVWAPNDFPWDNYALFYPGDAFVDWVGISTYMSLQHAAGDAAAREAALNNDLLFKLSHIVEQYGARKPIMIVESASSFTATNEPNTDFTDWAIFNMNRFYSYVPRFFPQVKGIFYFSETTRYGNYRLTENARVMQNYRRLIASDFFLERMDRSATYFFQEVGVGAFVARPTRLSAYVSIYDRTVSRVEYDLRNLATGAVTRLGQSTQIPFEISHDFTNLARGEYELIARVFDSRGRDAGVKSYRINNAATAATAAPPVAPQAPDAPSSWAQADITQAESLGLLPQAFQSGFQQPATRAEFAALAVAVYENLKGPIEGRQTFGDTNDVNVQKAASVGIVTGIGNNMFNPGGNLTRQDAAVMLARLSREVGHPLEESAPTFADNASISGWATASVGAIQEAGIMSGVGNNAFNPQGTYTREMSVVTAMRLFNRLTD